jgi:hypothetical protein
MSIHGGRLLSLLAGILPLVLVGLASGQEQKPASEPTA